MVRCMKRRINQSFILTLMIISLFVCAMREPYTTSTIYGSLGARSGVTKQVYPEVYYNSALTFNMCRAGISAVIVPNLSELAEITPNDTITTSVAAEVVEEEIVEEIVDETIEEKIIEKEVVEEITKNNEVEEIVEVEEVKEIPEKVLNSYDGVNYYEGNKETYYNLDMSRVIQILDEKGIEHGEYWVRDDGVKMVGDYVMVAADTYRLPKGTIIDTSLGTAMVVDHCSSAEGCNGVHLDVAVTW